MKALLDTCIIVDVLHIRGGRTLENLGFAAGMTMEEIFKQI